MTGLDNWLESYGILISWFLAVLGWWWVRKNGNIFARRTEIRSLTEKCQKRLQELRDDAKKYWLEVENLDSGQSLYCMDIHVNLALLDSKLRLIKQIDSRLDFSSEYIAFKQSVTADPFDSPRKKRLSPSDERLLEIDLTFRNFYIRLDDRFAQVFNTKPRNSRKQQSFQHRISNAIQRVKKLFSR